MRCAANAVAAFVGSFVNASVSNVRPDQKDCADQRRHSQPGVERKADGDIERQPGHIQKCHRARAGQERAHLIEIANGLESVALPRIAEGETRNAFICAQAQTLAERPAHADENSSAQDIEKSLKSVQGQDQDRETDQGGDAAARQHAVIHFEHVQRAGQIQDVDQGAGQPERDQRAP